MADQPPTLLPQVTPPDFYWTFAGPINDDATQRIVKNVPLMVQIAPNAHVHFLFQSTGGTVGDGIWLHNFFKSFPRDLTVYNAGSVCSIAVIAYLGAPKRKASANATFMIHRTTYMPQPATATNLKHAAGILAIDDERTEAVLKACATLSDGHWRYLEHHDLWLTAAEALEVGIVHEVGDFAPPKGSVLFAVV